MSLPGTVWHGMCSDPTLSSFIPAATTGFLEHYCPSCLTKADLLALKMPPVQLYAFQTQFRLFFLCVVCWIDAQKQQEWCFALLETQYCRMMDHFLVFCQLLMDKRKHSRRGGLLKSRAAVEVHLKVPLSAFTGVHSALILLMSKVRQEPKTETYKRW